MVLRGTNNDESSRYNQRVVLEILRRGKPLSRSDIARATGLAFQTISNIAEYLIDQGLVVEERRSNASRGQPPQDLRINAKGRYSIGVSIDRRWLEASMTDFSGAPMGSVEIGIQGLEPARVLLMVCEAIDKLVVDFRIARSKLLGVGLAMSGLTEDGHFVNLVREYAWRDRWRERPIVQELKTMLNLPVFTDGDRLAASIGARMSGVGKDYASYVYVFLGAGIGAGLMVSGIPFRGFNGKAGEIGHMIVSHGGRECPCGNRGCLEQYVSLQAAQTALENTPFAAEPMDAEMLSKAFQAKHPAILAWLDEAAMYLQSAIVSLENSFDPEVVLLGGLIPEDLLDALISRILPLPPSLSAASRQSNRRVLKAATGRRIVAEGAAALPILHATAPDLKMLRRHEAIAFR